MTNVRRIYGYFIILLTGIVLSCSDGSEMRVVDNAYFPLYKGAYHIYTVTEKTYSISDAPITREFELRTVVVDSFLLKDNTYSYVLYRYSRDDESKDWTYIDTWSAYTDANRAIMQEGNTSFVKISFPAQLGRQWDGNAYNPMAEDEYEIIEAGAVTVEGKSYDDCITIRHEDNQDFIVYRDKRMEVYARGVGLIYMELVNLHYCTVNCNGLQQVDIGVERTQSLKSYGTL